VDHDRLAALRVDSPNFRDVGGRTTTQGRTMSHGVAYRTGQLSVLSDEARDALLGLGIVRVVDLRTSAERDGAPDRLPDGIDLLAADVLADDPQSGAARLAALSGGGGASSIAEVNRLIGDGRSTELMVASYRGFVTLPSAHQAYAALLRGIAVGDGAVAFHCTAGKDRTGWGAAVLQLLVGTPVEAVMDDYLASNAATRGAFAGALEAFERAGGDAEAMRAIVDVQPLYLETALAAMTQEYGSIEGYVVDGLGLPRDLVSRLVDRLLD
jgi:protein-tyrosine phosphatase